MPFVRYRGGADYRLRNVGTFTEGDEREVDADTAAYLADVDGFEVIELEDSEPESEPDDESEESEDSENLDGLSHDALKERAEELGIADEIDLRSKASIIDGIREYEVA